MCWHVFALFYEAFIVKKPNVNQAHVMIITGAWDSTQSQLLMRLLTSERMEKGSSSQRLWQLLPSICCTWKRGAVQPEWERMSQGGTHTPDDLMEVDLNKAAERRSNHAGSAIAGKKSAFGTKWADADVRQEPYEAVFDFRTAGHKSYTIRVNAQS